MSDRWDTVSANLDGNEAYAALASLRAEHAEMAALLVDPPGPDTPYDVLMAWRSDVFTLRARIQGEAPSDAGKFFGAVAPTRTLTYRDPGGEAP